MNSDSLSLKYLKKLFPFFFILLGIFLSVEKSYAFFDEMRSGNSGEIHAAISQLSEDTINSLATQMESQEILKIIPSEFHPIVRHQFENKLENVIPLHLACFYKNYSAVEQLLQKKININAKTTNKWTALDFLIWGSYGTDISPIIQLLKKYDFDFNHFKPFATNSYFFTDHLSFTNILDSHENVDIEKIFNLTHVDSLTQAVHEGNTPHVIQLVKEEAHLKDPKGMALLVAILNSRLDMIQLLLSDKKIKILPEHFFAAGLIMQNEKLDKGISSHLNILFSEYSKESSPDVPMTLSDAKLYSLVYKAELEKVQEHFLTHKSRILTSYYFLSGHVRYKKGIQEAQKFYQFLKDQAKL